jgi:phage shock protein PspC (stress-responsive transcriptional regulator)
MKKTVHVNIGGLAFILDEEAQQTLHNYFEKLRLKFLSGADSEEVIRDIEIRIAELFTARLGNRQVVSMEDVQEVMKLMGSPEDIAGEEVSGNGAKSSSVVPPAGKAQRRLFRDPEDSKVAGVIAGLCHYFGVQDPTWVRLLVVISLFFSFGTIVLIYALLWMVMPVAYTAADKLMMRGEPINIVTIEKEVREAAERIEKNITSTFSTDSFAGKLGNLILLFIKGVWKIFLWALGLFALFLFVIIAGTLFGAFSIAAVPISVTLLPLLGIGGWLKFCLLAGIILFLGMPLLGIIYLVLRLIFDLRNRAKYVKRSLFVVWLIGTLLLIASSIYISREFQSEGLSIAAQPLIQPADSSGLMVQINKDGIASDSGLEESESSDSEFWDIVINEQSVKTPNGYRIGKPWIKLYPSKSGSYELKKVVQASGRNVQDGRKNASQVHYDFSQTDTLLTLDGSVQLNKKGIWRDQKLYLYLGIPEGRIIHFSENIDEINATVKNDDSYDNKLFANTRWTNSNGKMVCLNCVDEIITDEAEEEEKEEMEKPTKPGKNNH